MRDVVEVFLGEVKCALERFQPKPGDVFVLTVPGEISLEEERRIKTDWVKRFPGNEVVVVLAGGTTVHLDTEVN
jgi:hypothetical protein